MCQEGEMSWFHRERAQKLCVQDPSRLHPRYLFIWLVLMCTLYNKIVIISVALSWVLLIIIPSTIEPEKIVGNPQFVACQSEVQVAYGSLSLWITSGVRAVLLDTLTLNCGFWANSGCLVAKIHGSTRDNILNDTSLCDPTGSSDALKLTVVPSWAGGSDVYTSTMSSSCPWAALFNQGNSWREQIAEGYHQVAFLETEGCCSILKQNYQANHRAHYTL